MGFCVHKNRELVRDYVFRYFVEISLKFNYLNKVNIYIENIILTLNYEILSFRHSREGGNPE